MYWTATFIAVGGFLLLLLVQIWLGHFFKPKSEDKFILGLYVILPFVLFMLLLSLDFGGWLNFKMGCLAYFLFFVICSSWVASYPALYASCPTLIISLLVAKTKTGVTLDELHGALSLKQNSIDRIEDAMHDRLVKKTGSGLEMTRFGQILFAFFKTYRKILSLPMDTI